MLVKGVLNQKWKSQRLKARHRWLTSRQNLLRKKKKQKKVQEPELPEQDFKPFDYSQSNFKIFDGETLPFFICMFPIGSLSSLFVFYPLRQIKREFTVWSKQTSTWTQAEGMNLFSVTQLSAGMDLAVLDLISLQLWFSEKRTEEKHCGRQEHVLHPRQIWQVTHTQLDSRNQSLLDKMCMMGLFLFSRGFRHKLAQEIEVFWWLTFPYFCFPF